MSGNINSKIKLLCLMDIFHEKTDENNVLSALDICKELEKKGISSERKSIYSDIDVLREYGMDIIHTRIPKNGYFLAERKFEVAEVRLLIDAVQSANFITKKKTNILIDKIDSLVSEDQAKNLRKQVYVENRLKCSNEEIYYNIDILNEAIKQQKQVEFIYERRKITNKMTAVLENKTFVVSPYALVWANDHYYLICNNAHYENLMHVRLDRIKKVKILDVYARPCSEVSIYKNKFDVADYSNKVFNMFSGDPVNVSMKCKNEKLEIILDRFGEKVPIKVLDSEHFCVNVDVASSDGFISWIMQYGDDIEILSPGELRNKVKERLLQTLQKYK